MIGSSKLEGLEVDSMTAHRAAEVDADGGVGEYPQLLGEGSVGNNDWISKCETRGLVGFLRAGAAGDA